VWGNVYGLPFTPSGDPRFTQSRQPVTTEEASKIQHAPLSFTLFDALGHQSLVILMQVIEVLNSTLPPGRGWSIVANTAVTTRTSVDPSETRFRILLQMFALNIPPRQPDQGKRSVSGMVAYCIYVPEEHNTQVRDNHWVGSVTQRSKDIFGRLVEPREDMDSTPRPKHYRQYDSSDTPGATPSPGGRGFHGKSKDLVVSSPSYSPFDPVRVTAPGTEVEPSPKRKRGN